MKSLTSLLKSNKAMLFAVVLFAFIPVIASAGTAFVQCGPGYGKPCELCDLFSMGGRIIDWLLKIAGTLAVLVTILGGMMYLTSLGDQKRLDQAKGLFLSALMGLIFIFLSWSFIVIIYKAVGAGSPVYWWNVCS